MKKLLLAVACAAMISPVVANATVVPNGTIGPSLISQTKITDKSTVAVCIKGENLVAGANYSVRMTLYSGSPWCAGTLIDQPMCCIFHGSGDASYTISVVKNNKVDGDKYTGYIDASSAGYIQNLTFDDNIPSSTAPAVASSPANNRGIMKIKKS